MTIEEILQSAHIKVFGDQSYPEADDDDLVKRMKHLDDGISEWENCVRDGIMWPELIVSNLTINFGGTGTDALFTNFLCFMKLLEDQEIIPAMIVSGSQEWTEVKPGEGVKMAQQGLSPYVFWREGNNIRTLPALSGTINVPYLRKATRFSTGTETTEPDMSDTKFLEDFVTAKIFLDNKNGTQYTSYMNQAKEKLSNMKYSVLA